MMKKHTLLKLLLLNFFANTIIAQVNDYPSVGDVTIHSYSPALILQRDSNVGGFTSGIQTKLLDGTDNWFFGNLNTDSWRISKGDYQNAKFTILSNGNVGIGTKTPLSKLEIAGGNLLVRNIINEDGVSSIMLAHSVNISDFDTTGTSIRTITQNAGGNNYALQFFTEDSYLVGQTEKLRIQGNGNIGIGITNPQNKLDVNGTIHSREVKVDMDNWSDFVFKKEYNLPTLEQVEKHIAEKGHLENIPSEKEVLENGISLGEMNAKLLQKIEELTLYMIEMKKENTELKKRIEKIEKK